MAFSRGRESNAAGNIKRYIGVGNFKCEGLNLSNKELSELYGHEIQGEERQFVREVDLNGVRTKAVNLNFTMSATIGESKEFFNLRLTLFDAQRIGSDSGKVAIMDEYGRTAWATPAEFEVHVIPTYSSGPANVSSNYRGIYRGEDMLTRNDGSDLGFLTALLNIPNVTKFVDSKPVGLIDNPSDAECRLEHPDKLFLGDFSEVKEILSYQPENTVKLALGVRKDDQNRLWQEFFTGCMLRSSSRNLTKLQAAIDDAKNRGQYADTVFEVCDLKEYVESPSVIPASTAAAAPASPWFKKQ